AGGDAVDAGLVRSPLRLLVRLARDEALRAGRGRRRRGLPCPAAAHRDPLDALRAAPQHQRVGADLPLDALDQLRDRERPVKRADEAERVGAVLAERLPFGYAQ